MWQFLLPPTSYTHNFIQKWNIIHLTHANVWESIGKPCSYTQFIKSRIFYYKSRKNPYQYCKSRENQYQYCKSRENQYQYCKSCENLYQVLQAMRESVSGTTSHVRIRISTCAASDRAMKSKVRMTKSLSP